MRMMVEQNPQEPQRGIGLPEGNKTRILILQMMRILWAEEHYVRGAYTFSGPAKHRYALAQAEGNGRLIFAGEHTSKKHHSLVPGAAYEGRRAALEAVFPL